LTLWRKSLGYAVGKGISSAIAFLLLPIITRLMSPAEYGQWQIIEFWAILTMFCIRLGLEQALFKFYVMNPKKRGRYLFEIFSVMTILSIVFIIIGYFLRKPLTALFLGSQFSTKFAIMAILWGVADSFFSVFAAIFQSEEKVKLFALMDISRGFLAYGFAIFFLVIGYGVSGVVGARIGATFAVIIVIIPIILRRIEFKFDKNDVVSMLKYGLPLTLNLFVVRIFSFSDRWLLAKLDNFSVAGSYSAGVKIASIIVVIILPIRYAWSARLFHMYKDGTLKSQLPQIWRQLAGGMSIVAVGLILLSPEIFKLFIGPGYEIGMKIVPLLAAAYFLDALILIADAGIYVTAKTSFVPIFTAVAAAINVALNILWIPKYGAVGAAVAAIFGFSALLFLSWRTGQFFFPIEIPYSKVLLSLVAVAVSVWIALSVPFIFVRILTLIILWTAVFFGTGLDSDIFRKNKPSG